MTGYGIEETTGINPHKTTTIPTAEEITNNHSNSDSTEAQTLKGKRKYINSKVFPFYYIPEDYGRIGTIAMAIFTCILFLPVFKTYVVPRIAEWLWGVASWLLAAGGVVCLVALGSHGIFSYFSGSVVGELFTTIRKEDEVIPNATNGTIIVHHGHSTQRVIGIVILILVFSYGFVIINIVKYLYKSLAKRFASLSSRYNTI